jgi:2-oxoglutarate/2-oxoacid ferredoxin oxidoreductase subunit alpha
VLAAKSPGDCYYTALEAVRIATKWMTPVLMLTDGYLGFGSEPFRIPEDGELKPIKIAYQSKPNWEGDKFMPYLRDEKLIRPWAVPGTPGLEHRIGGLEKDSLSGMVSYDGMNHEKMVKTRAQKVANVVEDVPDLEVEGPANGDVLLASWGGTFGSVRAAAVALRAQGKAVGHAHFRWLNPMPKNTAQVLRSYKKIVVPEVNAGQLAFYLRAQFPGVDPIQHNRINGKALKITELVAKVNEILG